MYEGTLLILLGIDIEQQLVIQIVKRCITYDVYSTEHSFEETLNLYIEIVG